MFYNKNKQYFTIAFYAFMLFVSCLLTFLLFTNFDGLKSIVNQLISILQPVIIGFVLAYLLNPILKFFEKSALPKVTRNKLKPRANHIIAMILCYLTAIIFVGTFIAIVLPQLIVSITSLVKQVPQLINMFSNWYFALADRLASNKLIGEVTASDQLVSQMMDKSVEFVQHLLERLYSSLEVFLPNVFLATTKITTGFINVIVGIIISVYLLNDKRRLMAGFRKFFTAILPTSVNKTMGEIVTESNTIFSGFIVGKCIDSLIIGIICFIGMLIFRMDYAVLISVIVGVTNVIPYFGPFIGAIPGIIILLIVDPMQALWFLLFIFLLQQFDGNILGPRILGDTTGLTAFWVIFSIMFFSGIFGILGMFIGVPVFAIIYSITKRFTSYLLSRKGLPSDTNDYDTIEAPLE